MQSLRLKLISSIIFEKLFVDKLEKEVDLDLIQILLDTS